jgi:hypothetical protein
LKGIRERPSMNHKELFHKDSATQLVILEEEKQQAEKDITRSIENVATTGDFIEHNKEMRVAASLSNIIALSIIHPFKGFDESYKCWEMHNYSENSLQTLSKKQANKVVEFNKNHMTRIYPKGTRFSSSNYNPTPSWNTGCQIVSLNYQKSKTHEMRYHNIRFEENGNCGYILKPDFLCRSSSISFDPTAELTPTYELTVEVISAEMLPKPQELETGSVIDPYVVVEMVGVERDEKSFKTKTVWNNGLHPTWHQSFTFQIHCFQLACLRLAVYDKETVAKNIFVCENYIPLKALRTGYRSVAMRQDSIQIIDCCHLLVRVELKEL